MELKLGWMEHSMKVIIKMEKKMDKEHLNGLMDQFTKVTLLMGILKEKVNLNGKMEEFIQENGKMTKWMVKE